MKVPKLASTSFWSPTSWQSKPIAQPIIYDDQKHLSAVTSRLAQLPDLVPAHEIDQLSQLMAHAARGEVFVIQGGDCAEAFRDAQPEIVTCKRQLMADQAQCLSEGMGLPVVAVGRIAGQYCKPRSSCFETLSCGSVVQAVSLTYWHTYAHIRACRLTVASSFVETISIKSRRLRDHQIRSVFVWATTWPP